jgi:hypothetical protein
MFMERTCLLWPALLSCRACYKTFAAGRKPFADDQESRWHRPRNAVADGPPGTAGWMRIHAVRSPSGGSPATRRRTMPEPPIVKGFFIIRAQGGGMAVISLPIACGRRCT